MYVNKCSKCGSEFETKNPKRVICPNCLYPERTSAAPAVTQTQTQASSPPILSTPVKAPAPQSSDFQPKQNFQRQQSIETGQVNYQNRSNTGQGSGSTQRPRGYGGQSTGDRPAYNQRGPQRQGDRPSRPGGGQRPGPGSGYRDQGPNRFQGRSGGRPDQQRGPGGRPGGRPPMRGPGGRPPMRGGGRPPMRGGPRPTDSSRKLLISKEQLAQIENLYKPMLPLPNPDIHEVIAKEIDVEPRKVFFGINLVRQKMKLPKLPFPKRRLAVTVDQLTAVETLYTPLLPLPPIGCHKIIAKQLKMDEWRVHVAIGIIRKQMSLPRWNPDREDAPEKFKQQQQQEVLPETSE